MRYIVPYVKNDLQKKMVFVGGPRQVGKTTMAQNILASEVQGGLYLNWDYDEDRQSILAEKWSKKDELLVFDELHKFARWKNWLKGLYDVTGDDHSFLVTGSARLDVYRRGGDSLLGRYHYWRLHPFTLDELPAGISQEDAFSRLMTVGGFPEPFLLGDERQARRWRRERFDRVIREDIRDLESVHNIQSLSLLLDLLRRRVSGPVVMSNLAGDIQVSPKTVTSWLEVLERMYLLFMVKPFSRSLPRAILKPPKVYFFDNADVLGDEGTRFENLVATSLLKRLHFLEDRDGFRYELRYIRDKEKREVDFAILKEGVLEELIETKFSDDSLSSHLAYYANRLKPRKVTQIVANLQRPYDKNGIRVVGPFEYFAEPPWKTNQQS
jgi:predicted AAA+ superfamily ATPase